MTVIRVSGFGGIIPRLGKRLLPDSNAQYALNAQLFSGELRAWQKPKLLATFPIAAQDVYHYRRRDDNTDHYIPFDRKTDVVKAPIINDAYGRLYWTNGTAMYTTTMDDVEASIAPVVTGVPAPAFTTPITVTAAGGTTATAETRVYTVILVSKYGEEGAPALASTITVSGNADGTWTVAHLDALNTSGLNANITKIRLYRTIDAANVTYREVAEWDIGTQPASYVDNVSNTTLSTNAAMQSLDWTPPPAGLSGLCAGPGGMLAAFTGKTVRFSVPFFPHAWPEAYQLALEDDIVAMGWVGSMLIIGTTGRPGVIQGTGPTSLSLQRFDEVLPCLSAHSLVTTSAAVFYASLDGLLAIGPQGVNNVTQAYATRKDWIERFSPASLSGAVYQGRYFGFYSSQLGFSLGFDDATTGLTDLQYDGLTLVKNSAVDNSAQMLVGNKLYQWDEQTLNPLLYVWRTKPFVVPKPCNMGVLQLRGDFIAGQTNQATAPTPINPTGFAVDDNAVNEISINGIGGVEQSLSSNTVGVKIYGDGKLRWVGSVRSEAPVRLPSGFKCTQWEIELSGSLSVFSVVIATTMQELEAVP